MSSAGSRRRKAPALLVPYSRVTLSMLGVWGLLGCGDPLCEDPLIPTDEIDRAMADELEHALESAAVKGYGFAIGDPDGQPVATGCGGLSRDERGVRGRLAFTPTTANNWGSVAKLVTAAAVLHAIDRDPMASLDDPLSGVLPMRWADPLHPDYQAATLRQLLQHKAGFDRNGEVYELDENGEAVDLVLGRLSEASDVSVGTRSYSNMTGMLGHFAVAYLTDSERMREAELRLREAPDGDFTRDINLEAARAYVDYVQEHLLGPAGVEGSCRITDFDGHAFYYGSAEHRSGDYPRRAFGGDHTDECSTGGWVFSPLDMLGLLSALRHGSLLSESTVALMENPEDGGDDALGYSQFRPITDGTVFCHGGEYQFIEAAVCSFPSGHQVVVNMNSGTVDGSEGLIHDIIRAYALARSL